MDRFHVTTGDIDMNLLAADHEDACVRVLKRVPLDKCGIFLCITKTGDPPGAERFGLTELYLERSGYESVGEHRWRKKRVVRQTRPPVSRPARRERPRIMNQITKVVLNRTPEEWAALVAQAKTNLRPT